MPPEYCMYEKKDNSECKMWLMAAHPELFQRLYPDEEAKSEPAEEQKQEAPKKKKKVGFGTPGQQEIRIIKAQRRGKKVLCTIVGLQSYGVNLKDMAKIMSKRFASSAAVTNDDQLGEVIQVQGNIGDRFEEFYEAELTKYKIPFEKIVFQEIKKKKGGAKPAEQAEEERD